MVVVNFILQKKASFFNEFHYLKDFHLHKLFYTLERIRDMNKKWMIVIISLIFIVALIGVGGKMFIDKRAEQKEAEKIEAERMSVEALKNTFKNIQEVKFKHTTYEE